MWIRMLISNLWYHLFPPDVDAFERWEKERLQAALHHAHEQLALDDASNRANMKREEGDRAHPTRRQFEQLDHAGSYRA